MPDSEPTSQPGPNPELIREITQSVLAVLIVVGALVTFIWIPVANNDAVIGVLGAIVGYYFARDGVARTVDRKLADAGLK